MLAKQHSLYEQVVDVTMEYLGPAAERFITRQIKTHIGKEPEDLTQDDLEKLVDWIKLAIALLTEDNKMVDDFSRSLLELSKKRTGYEKN
jgi:wobble nucleotide-excising tRNase